MLVALALSISSCSNPSRSSTEQPVETSSAVQTTTSAAPSGPVEVELGETITLTQNGMGPREVDLVINDISVSRECHNGESGTIDHLEGDGYYIQMTGEMDAKKLQGKYGFDFTDLTGLDSNGYTVTINYAHGCESAYKAKDDHQSFSDAIGEAEKARGVLEFWTSELPETLKYTEQYEPVEYFWNVPEFSEPATTTAEQSEPAAVEEASPAAAPEEPYVVECLQGTPGPALWSDGTMAHSDYCWHANGGPAYAEAESQSGLKSFEDHEGYDPNPFRSDGCFGPAAVCGYYDDQGNPIWFDKMTGETSPRYYDEFGNPTVVPQ